MNPFSSLEGQPAGPLPVQSEYAATLARGCAQIEIETIYALESLYERAEQVNKTGIACRVFQPWSDRDPCKCCFHYPSSRVSSQELDRFTEPTGRASPGHASRATIKPWRPASRRARQL